MTKEYDKNKNPLYTNKSFLMTVNWKDLPNHPKWKQLVREYGWWYFTGQTNMAKTNFTRGKYKKRKKQ